MKGHFCHARPSARIQTLRARAEIPLFCFTGTVASCAA
jgi:hypothetical protein